MFNFFKKRPRSFEEQLIDIENCGITLNNGIKTEFLLKEYNRKDYEQDPYILLLVAMGGEVCLHDTYLPKSNDIWHFDTECIEDHGDYVLIAERIRDLSSGDLPFEDLKDYVDIDEGKAWLSFTLFSEEYHWNLTVDDDWVDSSIFDKVEQLLQNYDSKKTVSFLSLGQDCLVGLYTQENRNKLNDLLTENKIPHKFG